MFKTLLFILFFLSVHSYGQWVKCPTLVSERLVTICADTSGLVLVGGIDGTLLKSNDFGKTLRIVKTDIKHTFDQIIKVHDSLLLARIGNDGNNIGWKMYYSLDQGETWFDNKSPNFHFRGLQKVGSNLYLGPWNYNGSPNKIYRSTDSGKTWNFLSDINTTLGTDDKPLIIDDSNWYVSGISGLIMYTSDGGKTWEKQARGMTTINVGGLLKVEDTIVVTNGSNIWAGYYKKDNWVNTLAETGSPGVISYSGKYWWRNSQRGTDYSSSVFKWEKKRSDISLSNFYWIDTIGNGYAILNNNLYRTNNHGISTTSISEDMLENDINDDFIYYDILGQKVVPQFNQLVLKYNRRKGTTIKLVFQE